MSEISPYDDEELNEHGLRLRCRDLRARVAELERERDEARALWDDALRQVLHHSNARGRAEADAARLREALMQVRDAMLATGQEPDGDDDPRRPLASAVWATLDVTAAVPTSAQPELTPRPDATEVAKVTP